MKSFVMSILFVVLDFVGFCCACGPILLSAYIISNI